jgi:hypothetical protein
LFRRAVRRGKALDEVGAAIPADAQRRQEQVLEKFDISTMQKSPRLAWQRVLFPGGAR